jgi:hypothetical protein
MRKAVFAAVLAVSFVGFYFLLNVTFSGQLNAQELGCWCCFKGEAAQTPVAVCKQKGGVCFKTKYEAIKYCQQKCWCCVKGESFETNPVVCKEKGGVCFKTQDEAKQRCNPCWCCVKGEFLGGTLVAVCKDKDGVCMKTKEEAIKYCPQKKPIPGRAFPVPPY